MPLSRRSFVKSLGITGAGVAGATFLSARGHEALATLGPAAADAPERSAGAALLRLSSNENPRGPSPQSLAAVRDALAGAARYPSAGAAPALRDAVAAANGVSREHVLLGCGSMEVLRSAVDAFTGPARGIVAPAPSYEFPCTHAESRGAPVSMVRVGDDLRVNLAAMLAPARGAGLVFVDNPNNPTGTVLGAAAVAGFVRQVRAASPDTVIVLDEAYHDYAVDPAYATAVPLAARRPGVIVTRTFSKAHGIAGLRIGYAIAHPDTLARLRPFMLGNDINVLGAAAAVAALDGAAGHMPAERQENRRVFDYTRRFFEGMGCTVAPSETNFVFVDVRRDAKAFQDACRAHDVLVGRPFPPLHTWSRISLGTMDEMRQATDVFRRVLRGAAG